MNRSRVFLPSLADVFFAGVFIRLSLIAGKTLLGDADTGYHIRAGEFILDTFSVPKQDIFSFHFPPLPWTAHGWLSEAIMALIHRGFGLTGIVLFFSFVIALVYFLLFKILRANQGNILLAALLLALVIASSQLHWFARPHIFSLLLTVIWYFFLDAYQYKDKNYVYFLPPLMLLWVNLHAGFMLGFILLGVYVFGNFVHFIFSPVPEKKRAKNKAIFLALTTLACLLASLLNPYGYKMLLFPFQLTSDQFLMNHIKEYLSPNFHGRMPFRYLLFLTIAIFAISRARLGLIELLLIILFTHMALYSARYIPLFAIIAAPILLKQAESLLDQTRGQWMDFFKRKSNDLALMDARSKGYLWPAIAALVVCLVTAYGTIQYKLDAGFFPVEAVEFMKREDIKGNMFNNDDFGDYIIYSAWPRYKVFVDGRFDMYTSARIREYLAVTRVESNMDDVLEKYKIDWIIYNSTSALSTYLLQRDDWQLIYGDKIANIFVKHRPENQGLIDKYLNVKPVIPPYGLE